MAKNYFKFIPDFDYVSRLPKAQSISDYLRVKNLFKRTKISQTIFDDLTYFTKYQIIADERPDNIAYKIYGDSNLDYCGTCDDCLDPNSADNAEGGQCEGGAPSCEDLWAAWLESLFGTEFLMDKATRLEYGDSLMTHAMLFTGVDIKNNQSTKWRVENSWGTKGGNKGYYLMSDAWFDEYNYEVVVDKKYLPNKIVKLFDKDPIGLDPWDPMGSLAK